MGYQKLIDKERMTPCLIMARKFGGELNLQTGRLESVPKV